MRTALLLLILASSVVVAAPPPAKKAGSPFQLGQEIVGKTTLVEFRERYNSKAEDGTTHLKEVENPVIRGLSKLSLDGGLGKGSTYKVGDAVPTSASFDFCDGKLASLAITVRPEDAEATKALFIKQFGEPTPDANKANLIWNNEVSRISMQLDGSSFRVSHTQLMALLGQRIIESGTIRPPKKR